MVGSLIRKRKMRAFILGLLAILSMSCREQPSATLVREAVLSEGQSVEATNQNGSVKISYVSLVKRKYEWDKSHRVVELRPRQERFDGKLGLYEPADGWFLIPGTVRLVLDEAVRNFGSEQEIKAALTESNAYLDWVYTSDGLVVGLGRTPSRKQINIDLFQFLVRGEKPADLPGARPDKIQVTPSK